MKGFCLILLGVSMVLLWDGFDSHSSSCVFVSAGRRRPQKKKEEDVNSMERQPKAAVSFNDFEEGYIDDDEDEDGDEEGVFTPTRKGKRASFSNYLVKGSALDFLEESKQVVKSYGKKFAGETLAFITPWNNKGYDVAKAHAGKFDYISPVWYQLRRDEETQQIILTGGHDADRGWLGDVRAAAAAAAQRPRGQVVQRVRRPVRFVVIVVLLWWWRNQVC